MQRDRSSSPSPAAGGRVSKKTRVQGSKEVGEGCCAEDSGKVLERIEKLIIEAKADRLELTEVLKQLLSEFREAH